MKKFFKILIATTLTVAIGISAIGCAYIDKIKNNILDLESETDSVSEGDCEHLFKDIGVIKEATCTDKGVLQKECSFCKLVLDCEIPATGHSIQILESKEPSCKWDGLSEGQACINCGEIFIEQQILPASNHNFDKWTCQSCNQDAFELFEYGYVEEKDFVDREIVFNNFYRVYRPKENPDTGECICGSIGCYGFHGLSFSSWSGSPFIGAYAKGESFQDADGVKLENYDTCFYGELSLMHQWSIEGDFAVRFYDDYVDFYFGRCTFTKLVGDNQGDSFEINLGTTVSVGWGPSEMVKKLEYVNKEI